MRERGDLEGLDLDPWPVGGSTHHVDGSRPPLSVGRAMIGLETDASVIPADLPSDHRRHSVRADPDERNEYQMDSKLDRRSFLDPPARVACLVDGCPCKDARIISTRRVAFFAEWAKQRLETADRQIEPDPLWSVLFRPRRARLTDEHDRDAPRSWSTGPSYAGRPGS